MYAQLLEAALRDRLGSDRPEAKGQQLAELLRCRSRLTPSTSPNGRVVVSVADQLAYDIALIEFAHGVGVDFDLGAFDQPLLERGRLEQALVARGVTLASFDQLVIP
jgi:hypothetical protein